MKAPVISRLLFTTLKRNDNDTKRPPQTELECVDDIYKSPVSRTLTISVSGFELPGPCCVACSRTHPPAPEHASDAGCRPLHSSARVTAVGIQMIPASPPPWARSWTSAPSAGCCHCCQALEMTKTKKKKNRQQQEKSLWNIQLKFQFFRDMTLRHNSTSHIYTQKATASMAPRRCVLVHSKWK